MNSQCRNEANKATSFLKSYSPCDKTVDPRPDSSDESKKHASLQKLGHTQSYNGNKLFKEDHFTIYYASYPKYTSNKQSTLSRASYNLAVSYFTEHSHLNNAYVCKYLICTHKYALAMMSHEEICSDSFIYDSPLNVELTEFSYAPNHSSHRASGYLKCKYTRSTAYNSLDVSSEHKGLLQSHATPYALLPYTCEYVHEHYSEYESTSWCLTGYGDGYKHSHEHGAHNWKQHAPNHDCVHGYSSWSLNAFKNVHCNDARSSSSSSVFGVHSEISDEPSSPSSLPHERVDDKELCLNSGSHSGSPSGSHSATASYSEYQSHSDSTTGSYSGSQSLVDATSGSLTASQPSCDTTSEAASNQCPYHSISSEIYDEYDDNLMLMDDYSVPSDEYFLGCVDLEVAGKDNECPLEDHASIDSQAGDLAFGEAYEYDNDYDDSLKFDKENEEEDQSFGSAHPAPLSHQSYPGHPPYSEQPAYSEHTEYSALHFESDFDYDKELFFFKLHSPIFPLPRRGNTGRHRKVYVTLKRSRNFYSDDIPALLLKPVGRKRKPQRPKLPPGRPRLNYVWRIPKEEVVNYPRRPAGRPRYPLARTEKPIDLNDFTEEELQEKRDLVEHIKKNLWVILRVKSKIQEENRRLRQQARVMYSFVMVGGISNHEAEKHYNLNRNKNSQNRRPINAIFVANTIKRYQRAMPYLDAIDMMNLSSYETNQRKRKVIYEIFTDHKYSPKKRQYKIYDLLTLFITAHVLQPYGDKEWTVKSIADATRYSTAYCFQQFNKYGYKLNLRGSTSKYKRYKRS